MELQHHLPLRPRCVIARTLRRKNRVVPKTQISSLIGIGKTRAVAPAQRAGRKTSEGNSIHRSTRQLLLCALASGSRTKWPFPTSAHELFIRGEISVPVASFPVGPVMVNVNFIVGGEAGGQILKTSDTCTGLETAKGCMYMRLSFALEGCTSLWIGKACIKGQGFVRTQMCEGDPGMKTCGGGRLSAKLCAGIWTETCKEWIIYEYNNCGGGGDAGGG